MNHKRFYMLDAMRGVAALAVMGFHIGGIMRSLNTGLAKPAHLFSFARGGFCSPIPISSRCF